MRTLSVISAALAGVTGINPAFCYWAVLFTTAVLVCAPLIALAVALQRWAAVPLNFEEAKRTDPTLVFWGGRWLPAEAEKFHFRISGTTRSGKSLLFTLYLRSVISQITPGSDRRLVLFDPKNELHPLLFEGVPVPVHYLLPSDRRSSRWDLARDFDNPAAITQLCHALVPEVPGESSPYFTTAFREVMDGVMSSLNLTQPHRWDLADVVHILESSEYTARVLGRTASTESKLSYFGNEKTWNDIRATAENRLNALRITAAMWSRAQSVFSLREFVESESIVILGSDQRYAALLDPLNVLFLTQLFGHLLAQADDPSKRRRTYLAIDELTRVGGGKPLPGFQDVCEQGASGGVVVAAVYQSYAALTALYKDGAADAILGMLQHQIHLRAGDVPTAEHAARQFGKRREWVPVESKSDSPNGSSTTKSWQWLERYHVPPERFQELVPPSPEEGLWGYRLGPHRRDPAPFHLPGSWIAKNLPRGGEEVERYEPRPDSHQYLTPLSFADAKRLDLELADAFAQPGRPTEPPAAGSRPSPAAAAPADVTAGKLRHLVGVWSDAASARTEEDRELSTEREGEKRSRPAGGVTARLAGRALPARDRAAPRER